MSAPTQTLSDSDVEAVSGGVIIGTLTLGALAEAVAAAAQELASQRG